MSKFSLFSLLQSLEELKPLQAVRQGLVLIIPVITLGAMGLLLINLPFAPYQHFLVSFANGLPLRLLSFINAATYGYLSVYITIAVGVSYMRSFHPAMHSFDMLGALITTLTVFVTLSGAVAENYGSGYSIDYGLMNINSLGVKGMFTALVVSLSVPPLYNRLLKTRLTHFHLYCDGSDSLFIHAISSLTTCALFIALAAVFNCLLMLIFQTTSLQALFIRASGYLFQGASPSLSTGLCFQSLSSLLWFFGIHGSDVLEQVLESVFDTMKAGGGVLVNRTLIDCFVLTGGCGSSLALLLAVLLFAKRRNSKNLSRLAFIPVVFNINEILLFGLPVVLNVAFFIPFVCTPLLNMLSTTLAMGIGLVPSVTHKVVWTTPIFWSGYMATGSLAGSLLQLFNLVVGTLVYAPFVLMDQNRKNEAARFRLSGLTRLYFDAEENGEQISLLARSDSLGVFARQLTSDLQQAVAKHEITMFYQPHHDQQRRCVGAEALLRWEHPNLGRIAPPLLIQLAREAGFLCRLEQVIFVRVAEDLSQILSSVKDTPLRISLNITPDTLKSEDIFPFLAGLPAKYGVAPKNLLIEITEQTAMDWNTRMEGHLQHLHELGYGLAIDDFSMGHTSLLYLQCKCFDVIKLDGSLVRGLADNSRNVEIVASIIRLSHDLSLQVVAEYVETEAQFAQLNALGCHFYQGYLFSPALSLRDFMSYLKRHREKD